MLRFGMIIETLAWAFNYFASNVVLGSKCKLPSNTKPNFQPLRYSVQIWLNFYCVGLVFTQVEVGLGVDNRKSFHFTFYWISDKTMILTPLSNQSKVDIFQLNLIGQSNSMDSKYLITQSVLSWIAHSWEYWWWEVTR